MNSRASEQDATKEIYGATSLLGRRDWQRPKLPLLVAVRPVLLDSLDNSNRQSKSNLVQSKLVGEKQSSLNNGIFQQAAAAAAFSARADGYDHVGDSIRQPDSRPIGAEKFSHLERLSNVYNSNFTANSMSDSNFGFVKYDRMKMLELSIVELVEQSALAEEATRPDLALSKAREALESFGVLKNLIAAETPATVTTMGQPRLFELSLMVKSNLAEQLRAADHLDESMEMYMQLCKLASSDDGKFLLYRFGLNIGNILYQMRDYQRALKYYRLTLDRMSSIAGHKNLKIKLMNNISITLMSVVSEQQQQQQNGRSSSAAAKNGLISLSVLLADNLNIQQSSERQQQQSGGQKSEPRMNQVCNSNHHKFALNLLTCQYLFADGAKQSTMMDTMKSLVRADICHHHYRRVLEFTTTGDGRNGELDKLLAPVKGVVEMKPDPENNIPTLSSHAPLWSASVSINEQQTSRSARQMSVDRNKIEGESGQKLKSFWPAAGEGQTSALGDGYSNPGGRFETGQDQDGSLSDFEQNRASHQLELRGMSSSVSIISKQGETIERTKRQVLASIQRDRLEMMICRQSKLTSRSLIVGCNLMIDLDRHNKLAQQQISAFDFCSQLLSTSETYKQLVNDLKMNYAVETLLSVNQTRTRSALAILEQIEEQIIRQTKKSANTPKTIHHEVQSSATIGVNLCMLNLLHNNYEKATRHAENATRMDEYNPNGLINLANCYYSRDDLRVARAIYRRAIQLDPNCWQASYNLAIVTRKLGLGYQDLNESARRQLKSKSSESTKSMTRSGRKRLVLSAVQWAFLLQQCSMTDLPPEGAVQSELSNLFAEQSEQGPELCLIASEMAESEQIALKILHKANSEHPYHLPTLERLVALSIKIFDYQAAISLLLDCIRIRPDQPRWYQITAECCRRAAEYMKAIAIYKMAVDLFPRDVGCLRALTKIMDELGLKSENEIYRVRLNKLEAVEMHLAKSSP